MKRLAPALILVAGPALADDAAPKPAAACWGTVTKEEKYQENPDLPASFTIPVLTADEGRALYKLGIMEGTARAAVQSAQQEAKSAIEKISPPKP